MNDERIIYLLDLKSKYERNLKQGSGHVPSIILIIEKIKKELDVLLLKTM
jgi:hypothetical protein